MNMNKAIATFLIMAAVVTSAMSQSITTSYAGGNGHDGNMLDFTVTGTSDVTIDSLDFNINATAGTDAYILVYYKSGTYVGAENDPTQWIKHDSVHVFSAGLGNPTRVRIGGLLIPQGQTYGLYLTTHSTGPDVAYTDGANTYSDANVTVTTGAGLAYPFTGNYSPRTWNGTIYYSLNSCTNPVVYTYPPYCNGSIADLTAGGSSGFYNWYSDSGLDTLLSGSNPYTFTATNNATFYTEAFCPNADTVMMNVGTQSGTFSTYSRGYWFTSPCDFVITGLRVPTDITGDQTIQVVRFTNGAPPAYSSTTNNFVTLGYWHNVSGTDVIPANIIIHTGDLIGIVGIRGTATSYGAASPVSSTIAGNTVSLQRLGMQYNLSTTQLQELWTESGNSIGRVEMYYRAGYASVAEQVSITVNQPDFVTLSTTICQGDSVFLQGYYQHTSGIYYDTIPNTYGCDSVIETTLTVNPVFFTQNTSNICQGDSIFAEGAWQNITGLYYDTLSSVLGCDSVIELNLTVNPVFFTQNSMNICQGDSIYAEGAWQNTTGLYYDTLSSVLGCDSVIELNLTVNPLLTPSITISASADSICTGETVTFTSMVANEGTSPVYDWQLNGSSVGNGATYSTSGLNDGDTVFCILTSSNACVVSANVNSDTLTFTVMDVPVADFIYSVSQLTVNFTDNSTDAISYSWNFGDGNTSSVQSPVHTYSADGTYSVTLTVTNDCGSDDISYDVTVVGVGIVSDLLAGIEMYPNPTTGILTIELHDNGIDKIEVYDVLGKCHMVKKDMVSQKISLDMSTFTEGVYFVKLYYGQNSLVNKVIIKR